MTEEDEGYEEEENEDKPCSECALKIGAFMAIGICDRFKSETQSVIDCDQLARDYKEGKITADEIIRKLREIIKEGESLEYLDEIEKAIEEATKNG